MYHIKITKVIWLYHYNALTLFSNIRLIYFSIIIMQIEDKSWKSMPLGSKIYRISNWCWQNNIEWDSSSIKYRL